MTRTDWPPIIGRAAEIVLSYHTGVTLRQLFYRLLSMQLIPATGYKRLSELTAKGRRAGEFPDLIDRGRAIHQHVTFTDPANAMDVLISQYWLDRTAGQDVSLYLGCEKAGLVAQLTSWFGDLGIPILALGGNASQSYVDVVERHVHGQDRPAVLLYAGDLDASGVLIDMDFIARTDCWDKVERVALNYEQIGEYDLPKLPGEDRDPNTPKFIALYGSSFKVEVDALDPDDLRLLFQEAVDGYWDTSRYERVLAREAEDLAVLRRMAGDPS